MSLSDILSTVKNFQCNTVCVTGGEPLAQPGCIDLLQLLCDEGLSVSLETSGAISIENVDPRVMVVMDLKTPASGECEKNLFTNIAFLKKTDQIKFVLCNRDDYDWACKIIREHRLDEKTHILFSPSWQELNPTQLADWIVNDKLNVRFQLQLHKILWNDTPGH